MTLYLVIERGSTDDIDDNVYGVFSKKEKAMDIKDELNRNFLERNETYTVDIIELKLDEPTDDYYWFMNN